MMPGHAGLCLRVTPPLAILIVVMSLGTLDAIVVRHDRPDAAARRLGQAFAQVGQLPDGACALVAPTWAITAAHVAASLAPGAEVRFQGRGYTLVRAVLHPQGASPRGVPPEVDLALLEVSEAVRGITHLQLYRGRSEFGQTLTIVGYGDFGSPGKPLQRGDGARRAATNVVVDAGPRRLFMTFDAPPGGTALEGVGGPGDSGGPALLEIGGAWHVAGISSASMDGKPGAYGVTDVYTRVSSYVEWIDAVMTGRQPSP